MGKSKSHVVLYLIIVAALWLFSFVTLRILTPYSIAYGETGELTVGYILYAATGLIFSTPAPFISVLIIALFREHISLKAFFTRILHTEEKGKTAFLTAILCLMALLYAILCGTPNGEPWYMLPLGFLVMLPFVGIAEEAGWRGFLQPAMEKKLGFPFSVLTVAAIWYVWHLDQWLDPTSNHYCDSLVGFGITIFIWAFALAALYKATKSVIACAAYHAFIDSIGAVYDWNLLFDTFPGNIAANVFRVLWLIVSIALWLWADNREKQSTNAFET